MKEDFKRRLDSIPQEEAAKYCTALKYPVDARAGFALVRAVEKGEDIVKDWGAYGHDRYRIGIRVPSDILSKRIYVPKPILILDKKSKQENPFNGISIFSRDHVNVFADRISKGRILYEKVFNEVTDGTGASRLKKLVEDPQFRKLARLYSKAMLLILKRSGRESCRDDIPKELFDLSRELIDFYISEI